MTTLKDVAALAHVDVSTVSRALNNSSYVHPDTRARIMKAVEELSYRPNVLAQGLKKGKRNTIGVVIPKLSFSIFSEILDGIDQAARKSGYSILVCDTGDDRDVEKEYFNRLRNGFVDGIILAGTGFNKRLVRDIKADGMAITQVIRDTDPTMCSVVVDYTSIGYRAVRYLTELGCKKIGLINGSMKIKPYADRCAGYRKAIRELGLEEIMAERESKKRGMKYGYDCALRLIDGNTSLDAILAGTDAQGMGVLRALRENHLRVPEDIKVLSMTGHQVGDMLETSLTSMELPGLEIGMQAANMTIRTIEADADHKPATQHLVFDARLAVRESTGGIDNESNT